MSSELPDLPHEIIGLIVEKVSDAQALRSLTLSNRMLHQLTAGRLTQLRCFGAGEPTFVSMSPTTFSDLEPFLSCLPSAHSMKRIYDSLVLHFCHVHERTLVFVAPKSDAPSLPPLVSCAGNFGLLLVHLKCRVDLFLISV